MEQETATLAQHLQAWLQAQDVPTGAERLRVVFDGTHAHIVAVAGGQRMKLSVPFALRMPSATAPEPPAVAKKRAAARRR